MGYDIPQKIRELQAKIKAFVEEDLRPISLQVEKEAHVPEAVVAKMRRMGLFGLAIPAAYGGLGLSTLDEILIYEDLTQINSCFRSRIGTSNGIGSMGILFDGTDAQKRKY